MWQAARLLSQAALRRVLAAPLLHMGLMHVAFNMLAFVPIAQAQETALGSLLLLHTLLLVVLLGSVLFTAGSFALALW